MMKKLSTGPFWNSSIAIRVDRNLSPYLEGYSWTQTLSMA
eukprot:CAMPEP_0172519336 /NCGR_PEP_ID=MMETSP1066-20121228/291354_1 /TAXON_ID=671091 /ORGANISM="Coscinodiscus wailesii, Strain CCMP2513" /LENGTH=39 /DNA_ID= /DNA_START= /DNA_END= /DNA_ORIENTATION=